MRPSIDLDLPCSNCWLLIRAKKSKQYKNTPPYTFGPVLHCTARRYLRPSHSPIPIHEPSQHLTLVNTLTEQCKITISSSEHLYAVFAKIRQKLNTPLHPLRHCVRLRLVRHIGFRKRRRVRHPLLADRRGCCWYLRLRLGMSSMRPHWWPRLTRLLLPTQTLGFRVCSHLSLIESGGS
jgi:hypothetical protein